MRKINTNFIPKLGLVSLSKCETFMLRYCEVYVTSYLHKIRPVFIIVFAITPQIFQSNLSLIIMTHWQNMNWVIKGCHNFYRAHFKLSALSGWRWNCRDKNKPIKKNPKSKQQKTCYKGFFGKLRTSSCTSANLSKAVYLVKCSKEFFLHFFFLDVSLWRGILMSLKPLSVVVVVVAIGFSLNILRPAGQNDLLLYFGHLSSILLLPVCFQLCQNWAGLWFLCNIKMKTFIIKIYHGTASQMVWYFKGELFGSWLAHVIF